MNYIVLDFEFNQTTNFPEYYNQNQQHITREIIEIGAIKLSSDLTTIDTYQSFIKPIVPNHKSVDGLSFNQIYSNFFDWIGTEQYALCVWSRNDLRCLIKNCNFHNINIDDNIKYIDI